MADNRRPNVGDPDLRHLLDLVSLLPAPNDEPSFWERLTAILDNREQPDRGMTDYVLEKIAIHVSSVQEPSNGEIDGDEVCDFTKYLAIFFGAQKPELWKLLSQALTRTTDEADGLGKAWADDLMRTACVLVTRYSTEDNLAVWEAMYQ